MKQLILLLTAAIFTLAVTSNTFAQITVKGDTIEVQTFTFADEGPPAWGSYSGTFDFPPAGESYRKVLMYQTLKCDPSTKQDNFNCGEWDYLTYTYLTDSTGIMDSTKRTHPNFWVNGSPKDKFAYTSSPTFTTYQEEQKRVNYIDTTDYQLSVVGEGTTAIGFPLQTSQQKGKSQFLWRQDELLATGLVAGNVHGLKLQLGEMNMPQTVHYLTIRIKNTTLNELDTDRYEKDNFANVYRLNTALEADENGWVSFHFSTPFFWTGVTGIAAEFSWDEMPEGSTDYTVLSEDEGWKTSVYTTANEEAYFDFDGNGDYLDLGNEVQIEGNAPRTIEAWAYAESFNNAGIFQAGTTGTAGKDFSLRTTTTDNNWRVQQWGTGFDFDVTLPNSKNAWHHYCLTYDGAVTRLYYDGELVAQNTATLNTGDASLLMGRWNGSSYDGKIDEVRVWDVALQQADIKAWMEKQDLSGHPNINNLQAQYSFNGSNGVFVKDGTGKQADGVVRGDASRQKIAATDLFRNIEVSQQRPNVAFEQGTFTTNIEVNIAERMEENMPVLLTLFDNLHGQIIADDAQNHPTIPTDELIVWESDIYNYTFNENGEAIDSTYSTPEKTLIRQDKDYYSNIVRYELGRFITPYGINLDLGPEGFTWVFDVTDYAPLLHDKVYLQSGNAQELLDLKFVMIKGTPPRDVISVSNVWAGSFQYTAFLDDTRGEPRQINIPSEGKYFRVKTRTTGHGFGTNNENCAEFCRKEHRLNINGERKFAWDLWEECSNNPVFPQGGTWIYDRAGWCPGMDVRTYDHELTPYVTPGDKVVFDYEIEEPVLAPNGNWVMETQLVTYGEANFQLDAAISDIIAPNDKDVYSRLNPICDNPIIEIQNTGATTLQSVLITYGIYGPGGIELLPCYYRWSGNLKFMEKEIVELPLFNWIGFEKDNPRFWVRLSQPNIGNDEYAANDYMETHFTTPVLYDDGNLALNFRTNNFGGENYYELMNDKGEILYSRYNLSSNTTYTDLFELDRGCYVLRFEDTDDDGLNFFANNDGNGFVRLRDKNNNLLVEFERDYGDGITYHFTVDYDMSADFLGVVCDDITDIDEVDVTNLRAINIYPNPTRDKVSIDLDLKQAEEVNLTIYNALGQAVLTIDYDHLQKEALQVDMPKAAGVYHVVVKTKTELFSREVVVLE
ncbi:MAG: LamG-like jellyroll fold domain-containing protein [Chitinophagales bacterium]